MKHVWKSVALFLTVALLGTSLLAQTTSAARYDGGIQTKVSQKLTDKKEFRNVKASTEDGIVTLSGETRTDVGRDSAVDLVNRTPGVKDVVNNVRVAPASIFDDQIRRSALRAIYPDPVLNRYAIDPALPIHIVVDNGNLTLYGT